MKCIAMQCVLLHDCVLYPIQFNEERRAMEERVSELEKNMEDVKGKVMQFIVSILVL